MGDVGITPCFTSTDKALQRVSTFASNYICCVVEKHFKTVKIITKSSPERMVTLVEELEKYC